MEDEEDLRKMNEFMNNETFRRIQKNFQLEFQDFISFKQDPCDNELDDDVQTCDDEAKCFPANPSAEAPLLTLTEEEKSVIESCDDADLKKILLLNRTKSMELIKLHLKIKNLLTECDRAVEEKSAMLKNHDYKLLTQQTYVWKLAAPYFKDKKFFTSPLNADTVKKRAKGELTVYDLVAAPKWTPIEFDRLTNAIKCNYNINRQNDVFKAIGALKVVLKNDESDDKGKLAEMVGLREELDKLKKNDDEVPPLLSDEFVNWYKVADTFLKDKHTASECQSVWHSLVHPQINKSEWTEKENKTLEALAKSHRYQKWDQIASELGTNRTGFTTCLHYFSKLCDKFKRNKFTPDEDAVLLEVVDIHKIGNYIPWNKVVCHFTDRSRHQLYHRYTYFLSQMHVKRGKFSEAEDVLLIILVNMFGKNFKKCTEYMPHRSQVQLKSRYNSNLQRDIKKGTFTTEDDQIILDYVKKFGEKNWSGLYTKLSRCNAQIRQRYKLIKTFLRSNPDAEVHEIPKRRHRYDHISVGQHSFLHYVAEQYSNAREVPTLAMIEDSLQVETKTPLPAEVAPTPKTAEGKFRNIDTMLIDFFSDAMKTKRIETVTGSNIKEAADNMDELLSVIGANLSVPKDLECNIHLDGTDVEILRKMADKNGAEKRNKMVAPNIDTLTSLRSLIIKHKEHKSLQKSKTKQKTNASWQIEQNLLQMSEANRKEVLLHRELFAERFEKLFSWSAILSLEKPCQSDAETNKRASEQNESVSVKKRKVDLSVLSTLSRQSGDRQVRLVDKSVVERLMGQTNQLNIIKLGAVTGVDGVVRPVLQADAKGTDKDSTTVSEEVDVEDLQDVQKLNGFLKSVKPEPNSEFSHCKLEEYRDMEEDVRLLNEVLVRVKSEPDGY